MLVVGVLCEDVVVVLVVGVLDEEEVEVVVEMLIVVG